MQQGGETPMQVLWDELAGIEDALFKLERAIARGRSSKWCLTLWRRFILARDGHKCIACGSESGLQAHHIFRRAVLPQIRYQTGNGMTLCGRCHKVPHEKWNGRPLVGEPLNWREGDDLDVIVDAYFALEMDAQQRGILRDEFYFISEDVLAGFRALQGFPRDRSSSGVGILPIREARLTWQGAPVSGYEQVGKALIKTFLQPATEFFDALDEELKLQVN